MRHLSATLTIGVLLLLCWQICLAEEAHDTQADFPELSSLHEIVAKIWHKHYPVKDWEAIRKATPELVKRTEVLQKASLPETLADRETAFRKQIEEFSKAVKKLAEAAKGNDDEAVKQCAFDMHMAFHDLIAILYSNKPPR